MLFRSFFKIDDRGGRGGSVLAARTARPGRKPALHKTRVEHIETPKLTSSPSAHGAKPGGVVIDLKESDSSHDSVDEDFERY